MTNSQEMTVREYLTRMADKAYEEKALAGMDSKERSREDHVHLRAMMAQSAYARKEKQIQEYIEKSWTEQIAEGAADLIQTRWEALFWTVAHEESVVRAVYQAASELRYERSSTSAASNLHEDRKREAARRFLSDLSYVDHLTTEEKMEIAKVFLR